MLLYAFFFFFLQCFEYINTYILNWSDSAHCIWIQCGHPVHDSSRYRDKPLPACHWITQVCCSAKYQKRDDRKLNLVVLALFDILAGDCNFIRTRCMNVSIYFCFENAQPKNGFLCLIICQESLRLILRKIWNLLLNLPKQVGQHWPDRGGRGLSHGV